MKKVGLRYRAKQKRGKAKKKCVCCGKDAVKEVSLMDKFFRVKFFLCASCSRKEHYDQLIQTLFDFAAE